MKNYSESEVKQKVLDIYTGYDYGPGTVTVTKSPGEYRIELSNHYERMTFNLDIIMQLTEYFDTTNIREIDCFTSYCDTCDFGEHEITLLVTPDNKWDIS